MPGEHGDAAVRLSKRLHGYRDTTRRACVRDVGNAARYAAATASAFALAGGAEAAVIYSGVQNLSIQNNPGSAPVSDKTSIDIDGAFGNDVRLWLTWTTYSRVSGGAYGTYFFYTNQARAMVDQRPFQLANAAGILLNGSFQAQRLSSGATISAGGSFGTNIRRLNSYTEFTPSRPNGGTWPASGTGFLGVQLDRGGDTHYGWIRLQLEDLDSVNGGPEGASDRITVVDWAYEDVAGAAIQAGSVPEPRGLALLAAGAAGLAAWRSRRRSRASG